MAFFVLNRTPKRYEGEWQREALYQMFRISTDYSRFRILFSKAFVINVRMSIEKIGVQEDIKAYWIRRGIIFSVGARTRHSRTKLGCSG